MRLLIGVTVAALVLSGCELMEPKKIDYKSAGRVPSLEVPPDLTAPSRDERYAVPDINPRSRTTTYALAKETGGSPQVLGRRPVRRCPAINTSLAEAT